MSSDDIVQRLWSISAHLRTIDEADVREAVEDAADTISRLRLVLRDRYKYGVAGVDDDRSDVPRADTTPLTMGEGVEAFLGVSLDPADVVTAMHRDAVAELWQAWMDFQEAANPAS